MSGSKRVVVSMPVGLLEEIDGLAALEKRNRSELIREAARTYIWARKREEIRERLKQGYIEMARLNLSIAENNCVEEWLYPCFQEEETGEK